MSLLICRLINYRRFEIAQSSNAWAALTGEALKNVGAVAAVPASDKAQWTKWFGDGMKVLEGRIERTRRAGCAVVACYGARLKNMIGMSVFRSCSVCVLRCRR